MPASRPSQASRYQPGGVDSVRETWSTTPAGVDSSSTRAEATSSCQNGRSIACGSVAATARAAAPAATASVARRPSPAPAGTAFGIVRQHDDWEAAVGCLLALFAVAAVVATIPAVGAAPLGVHRRRRARLRRGRLRRSPADDVPLLARRPPARAGRRAVDRPLQLPAARRAAGRPGRLAVSASRSGRSTPLAGPVVAWNVLLLLVTFAAGLFTYLWLRELDVPPWGSGRWCAGLRAGSLPRAPERRAPARVDRGARARWRSGPSSARVERRRARAAHLWGALAAVRRRLGPALRPAPPRARRRSRSWPCTRPCATRAPRRSGPGAACSPPRLPV